MIIAGFDRYDLHNVPMADGASFTIWFAGCTHACNGCHNKLLWDKDNGTRFTPKELMELVLDNTKTTNIKTVTLLGGEPLQQDADELIELCRLLHESGYTIWVYTGYTFEQANDIIPMLTIYIDYIKCGKYIEELRLDEGSFPITSNQKLYQHLIQFGDHMWVPIK